MLRRRACRLDVVACLVFVVLVSRLGADTPPPNATTNLQVPLLALKGTYVDRPTAGGLDPMALLGGGLQTPKSFPKLVGVIDAYVNDATVKALYLDLSAGDLNMGLAQLSELVRHLQRARAAGKKLYAWLENASALHYAIAAQCDRVWMADFGVIDLPSLSMSSMHFRDAMDMFGVQASVARVGDFKGAAEPYTLSQMSDHLREHYRAMISSINSALVDIIAQGRGASIDDIRAAQNQRLFSAEAARAAKLVDGLLPFGGERAAIVEAITKDLGVAVSFNEKAAKQKKPPSLFEFFALMTGVEPDARLTQPGVAVFHLEGEIVDGNREVPGSLVSGPTVTAIDKLTADDMVKAVVLRIDSPGGSATASEAIRSALERLAAKKPVVISMAGVAASGGYWITCIGRPIYAEPFTITGSIGVFAMKLSLGPLLRRYGVHVENIALDDSALFTAINTAWSDKDIATLQSLIGPVYSRFLALVSRSRKMSEDAVDKIGGGRVWSGRQAKDLGLVDTIGGLGEALAEVRKAAALDEAAPVVHLPRPKNAFEMLDLFGGGDDTEIRAALNSPVVLALRRAGFHFATALAVLRAELSRATPGPTIWLLHPEEIVIK
ncbi:MAG: signal peptide peptidase SppA [Planctomycetota bacterium]